MMQSDEEEAEFVVHGSRLDLSALVIQSDSDGHSTLTSDRNLTSRCEDPVAIFSNIIKRWSQNPCLVRMSRHPSALCRADTQNRIEDI